MIPKEYQKYESKVSVACVNYTTIWGDKVANLEKMKRMTRTAAKRGAEIVVFPELALSGYECDAEGAGQHQPCAMHEAAAETVPGPSTEEMASLARELDVYIIFGMPERDKKDPKIRYNAAAVISPEGILGTYQKLAFPPPPRYNEGICFTTGDEIPVWETRYGPIGVQICLDMLFYPEFSRIQALKGARLIINSTAAPGGPGQGDFVMQQVASRATENIVFTATANLTGKDRAGYFCGHSNIAGIGNQRLSHILAKAGEAEEIVSATLDFHLLHYWTENLKWRESLPLSLINKELKALEKNLAAKASSK
ncbi:carbon-nitrogen hydrolase family protein [Chloroflexota bacterium]